MQSQHRLRRPSQKVEQLPAPETDILPAAWGDSIELDEMWTPLVTKRPASWIWLAVSFRTGQILSFSIGDRDEQTGWEMFAAIPSDYSRKPVYTDGYAVYPLIVPTWRHRPCEKGSGQTNRVEGVNRILRHRVSYLVRRSLTYARNPDWLFRRLRYFIHCRNQQIQQRILHGK
jgi:insertion element IS1 protein InsB